MRKMLMLSVMLCLPACASKPPILTTPPARCSTLLPDSWSEGVEAAPVPDTTGLDLLGQVKAWASAYVQADAALSKANGRTIDAVGIVKRCEDMINAAR